jgi:hypothetical protein
MRKEACLRQLLGVPPARSCSPGRRGDPFSCLR